MKVRSRDYREGAPALKQKRGNAEMAAATHAALEKAPTTTGTRELVKKMKNRI